ncbi:hypothetical protein, partial [Cronobacter sakazakii]
VLRKKDLALLQVEAAR